MCPTIFPSSRSEHKVKQSSIRSALLLVLVSGCISLSGCDGGSGALAAQDEQSSATAADNESSDSGSDTSTTSDLSYQLVDTGQTQFYDGDGYEIEQPAEGEAFYGQDAAYSGTAMSYTDNGDGTVTDNVTGLIWEQSPTEQGTTWFEAVDYCDSLELAGLSDWRTPSLKELFALNDFSVGWPYLDTDYFYLVQSASQLKDQQFWAQEYKVDTEEAVQNKSFGVNHMTGHIKAYADGSGGDEMTRYVRCVSGEEYGINNFADNGDGTVTDHATGLMWAQDDSGVGIDWENALDLAVQANDVSYLGYSDWRLPNVKELQSIVDYSGVYPTIDESLFNITDEDSYFWTSTSAYFSKQDPTHYYAWYVAFGYAVDPDGYDDHGAGAVRFDTKSESGPDAEEPPRIYNYARLVRDVSEE